MRLWWRKYVHKSASDDSEDDGSCNHMVGLSRWERDYQLVSFERLQLLDEYLEMGKHLLTIH